MARPKTKKKLRETEEDLDSTTPEAIQRKKLKSLAFANNILSETQTRSSIHLNPSSIVAKHHGKDIIKKSQRKNTRYLFSFNGLFAPVAGGKIGDLKDLGTKNPILYLDFPQVCFSYTPLKIQFFRVLVCGFVMFLGFKL
jgi:hypothetical protein